MGEGVIIMELIEFTRLMPNQVWLCSGRIQHKVIGGCPCSPCTEGKQFSFGLYVWHPSSLTRIFKEKFQRVPRLIAIKRAWTLLRLVSGVSGSPQYGANRVHQANADLCLAVWGEAKCRNVCGWIQYIDSDSHPSKPLHGSHTN